MFYFKILNIIYFVLNVLYLYEHIKYNPSCLKQSYIEGNWFYSVKLSKCIYLYNYVIKQWIFTYFSGNNIFTILINYLAKGDIINSTGSKNCSI